MAYPKGITPFVNKKDATFKGDPNGDYVLSKHINDVQDAINRLETFLGFEVDKKRPITERIKNLENVKPLQVPSLGYFKGTYGKNETILKSSFMKHQKVLLGEYDLFLNNIIKELSSSISFYGRINGNQELKVIQTQISEWKNLGVSGIFLDGINDSGLLNRLDEQNILSSIEQEGLSLFLKSSKWKKLLENKTDPVYNETNAILKFPKETTVILSPFAYQQRYYSTEEIFNQFDGEVKLLRENNFSIAGFGSPDDQKSYEYIQAAGLIFSIDFLYTGPEQGILQSEPQSQYHWPAFLSNWSTKNPLVFKNYSKVSRTIENGSISINDDGSIDIEGQAVPSTLIKWLENTISGEAIKEGSLAPGKLSTYDIYKIVRLLNESKDDALKINPGKIDIDPNGGNLPLNIPASNLIQNVIEAINKKNNPNTLEKKLIEDYAIKSINANKITGDINQSQMEKNVIQAINVSSSDLNFLDVVRIKAINILSNGTANLNAVTANSLILKNGTVSENFSMFNGESSGYWTGNEGEFQKLYVSQLTVDKLLGLKDLHVENLTANNMGTLVLDAVKANIDNGIFQTIVTNSLKADTVKADLVTALNAVIGSQITNEALFGTAVINDASIKNLSASKLYAGRINTSIINLSSDSGHLKIEDNKIQIYDSLDKNNIRKKRILIGDVSSVTNPNEYGIVIFGEDGSTRLYDHTGVYNAGIHNNAISNEKIDDDAVDGRVILANSIIAKHIMGETITGDLIASNTILGKNILAETITGSLIAGDTISGRHIIASSIKSGHIESASIEAKHLVANAITAEKLAVGFGINLIKDGYDSFEQEDDGLLESVILSGNTPGRIVRDWSFDGNRSLYINGQTANNRIKLARVDIDYTIPVFPGKTYVFSTWAYTLSENQVPIRLGIAFNNKITELSEIFTIKKSDRVSRKVFQFTVPVGALRASLVLGVEATNTGVWFDCLQVEELTEGKTEASPWRGTSVTRIDGSLVETGRINAKHIHIGSGTVFGTASEIIDITNEGIKAKSRDGFAMLNSKGLEIEGGAFNLRSKQPDGTTVTIDGKKGMTVENLINKIDIDAVKGISVINKSKERIVLDLDPNTGDLRLAGTFQVFDPNNPEIKWTIQDKIEEIEQSLPYHVEIRSTRGNLFRVGTIDTTLSALVYYGDKDVTSTIANARLVWTRSSNDIEADQAWNSAGRTGKSIKITELDVQGNATFDCNLMSL